MRPLREVHRLVLAAIEEPPDTGEERRLDRLAATLWERERSGIPLDPGARCRLRHKLLTLAERTHEDRARHLHRARQVLDESAAERPSRGRA